MNWFTDLWRPKIKEDSHENKTVITDNLWEKCDQCGEIEYHKTLINNLYVCSHCQAHKKLTSQQRLDFTLDKDYQILEVPKIIHDPIKFTDSKKYTDRLKDAGKASNFYESIVIAKGSINKKQAVVAVMDFSFIGGSMGVYVGEAILHACQVAINHKLPFICFCSSGGARMQEGLYSLMQMPRTTLAVEKLKAAGLPFINVLTNPTMGGVLASFAMLGDITFAEPKAIIGFSGRRVIENTVREILPDNFQTAEFQYECGFIDQVVHRHALKQKLTTLLHVLAK